MFTQMYEIKEDKENKLFLVCPVGIDNSENFAIVCDKEFDAKSICAQIAMQMLQTPEQAPMKYKSIGVHTDGKTNLYTLK